MEVKEIPCECGDTAAFSIRAEGTEVEWVCHRHFMERLNQD